MLATLGLSRSLLRFPGDPADPAPEGLRAPDAPQTYATGRERPFLEVVRGSIVPEIAEEVASRQVARWMDDTSLSVLLARYQPQWRFHLKRTYLQEGEHSQRWRDLLQTMDELTWSLRPKRSGRSRKRLFALLPRLLERLHDELESIGLSTADQDALFAELAGLHAAAVRRGATESEASAPGNAEETSVEGQVEEARQVGVEDANSAQLSDEPPAFWQNGTSAPATQAPDPLSDLDVGTSMEFRSRRATTRVLRLTWVSRQRAVYVFRDPSRDDRICLTAARLTQCMGEGSARILSA